MSLDTYNEKRSFRKTSEPKGGKSNSKKLIFVIQKHQASHLHYDFRLEMRGVLKSWAVPKGPSINPAQKRLAQLVEDHPFDYKDFEGVIPEGNYGAGTVIVWDQGTYQPVGNTGHKNEDEKLLIKQFYAGKISIVLKGKKIKGSFQMIKTPTRGEKAWLLVKSVDKYASTFDISKKNKSVVSGLTIEEMTNNKSAAKWQSNRKATIGGNTESNYTEVAEAPTRRDTKSSDPRKTAKEIEVWKRIHDKEIQHTEVIEVEGKRITLINYHQEYWPGITKLHLIVYYQSIAQYLLRYLINRPLGLNVITEWAGEPTPRFLRNMQGNYPKWVKIFTTHRRIKLPGKSQHIDWVVCNDVATLIYMLNIGAVDLHPWAAQINRPDHPNYIVIDIDPDDSDTEDRTANSRNFKNVIKVAQAAKEFFDELGLIAFVKLSGKTGIHLLLPCAGIQYGDARTIAENIAAAVQKRVSKIATVNSSTHNRGGKVYIDASQNDYGDRLVAPYCVRAYKQPYVSAPLDWLEVNSKLKRSDFTIHTIKLRLNKKGDLFEGLVDAKLRRKNGKLLQALKKS